MAKLLVRVAPLLAAPVLAAGLGACSNPVVATQTPAVVSGTVTAAPVCTPGAACSDILAVVPRAVVEASGKAGTQEVRADRRGHYQISLLQGTYLLQAARAPGSTASGGVQITLSPSETRTVNLRISG